MSSEFARVNKPREIEEFLDTYLIRPLGYVLVLGLRHTPVTPNMVSAASVAAAWAAAWFYYERSAAGAALGLVFLLLTSALDSADGQLARATGRATDTGRIVDGLCDNLSFGAIYASILASYAAHGGGAARLVAVLALAAAVSHSAQSALTDYARQLFLYYCFGRTALDAEEPAAVRLRIRALASAHAGGAGAGAGGGAFFRTLLFRLHAGYASQQRLLLASSARLHRRFRARAEEDERRRTAGGSSLRERFAPRYRAANARLVRFWALLGPNAHKIGIVAASLVPLVAPWDGLRRLGMVPYFAYDLALNVPMLALILAQRRVDARLERDLDILGPEAWS